MSVCICRFLDKSLSFLFVFLLSFDGSGTLIRVVLFPFVIIMSRVLSASD